MTAHLKDHDVTAAVAGLDLDPAPRDHLESCLDCRRQVAAMQELIEARRDRMRAGEPDWDRQRAEVLSRLPAAGAVQPPWNRRLRPLLAAAAAALVAVALTLLWAPAREPKVVAAPELQVEEILADVDALLADDSLPGFEAIDPGLDNPEDLFINGES